MKPPVALQLIGPPRLQRSGLELHLPTRKTLALLAVLALEGRVGRDLLSTMLWQLDDAAARRNLRRELHRLRESGLETVVVDEGDALVLGASVECDVRRFERACAGGDLATVAALGPGPLLDGFRLIGAEPFEDWLAAQRQRHRERWCDAAEGQARALDAAGQPREALALLGRLIALDPLREAAVRLAMELHARLGEAARASALYERLRTQLARELELAPLPATRALAESLADGGDRPAPAAAGAQSPGDPLPARLPFVGRERLVRELEAAWAQRLVPMLVGEPGSGKSRLAADFVAAHGAPLIVTCRPADREIPYASAARALRSLLPAAGASALPDWVCEELARLVPELGTAPPPLQSAEGQARFVAAFGAAWTALLAGNFDAVAIDDWQWADAASANLFVHLVQRQQDEGRHGHGRAGLVAPPVLLAGRPEAADSPGERALARLADAGLLVRVPLAPLEAPDLQRLVQLLSGTGGAGRFAARLHRSTAGNPLFVEQTLRHLFDVGLLRVDALQGWMTPFDAATEDYRELPVPASVREAVLARVRALGEAAQRLVEAASLAGDPFRLDRLEGCIALAEFEAVAALEQALDAHVLVADDDAGGYRFAHDLVAQSVADGLSSERRRLLHRRLAGTAERCALPPARVAAHLEAAGDTAAAAGWRLRAADAAEQVLAYEDALTQLEHALGDGVDGDTAVTIHLRRGRIADALADGTRAGAALRDADLASQAGAVSPRRRREVRLARARRATADEAIDEALALAAEVVDDPASDAQERARALHVRAIALQKSGRTADARVALDAVLAQLGAEASPLRVQVHLSLGNNALRRGDFDDAAAQFARAVTECEALDDRAGLAQALTRVGAACMLRGDVAAARPLLERALAEGARARDIGAQRGAILNLVKLLTQAGEVERAAALLAQGIALSPRFATPQEQTAFLQTDYYMAYLRGDLDRASDLADRVVAHADSLADPYWRVGARVLVLDLALQTADLERAAAWLATSAELEAARAAGYHRVLVRAKQAWLLALQGDLDAAQTLLDTPGLTDEAVPEDRLVIDHVRARVALAAGRPGAAWEAVAADAAPAALDAWTLREAQRLRALTKLGRAGTSEGRALTGALMLREAVGDLPALEALDLQQALVEAQRAAGATSAAVRCERRWRLLRERLMASLGDPARARWQATGLPTV